MSDLKIAIIGAGSFVFGPSALRGAIFDNRLDGAELALVDIDREPLEIMGGLGRRMAAEAGVNARVTTHTTREAALDGAHFVVSSAAPDFRRRHEIDCDIVERLAPGHGGTEFGGVTGISYSLRQIAFVEQIAADMRRLCPKARFLNSSNPLPRVCQAMHERGIESYGFCMASRTGYLMLCRVFDVGFPDIGKAPAGASAPSGEHDYDWFETAGRRLWDVTMAGLNHFSWVLAMRDKTTGADLLGELRRRIAAGATSGYKRADAIGRETGFLLVPEDRHTADFLPPARPGPQETRRQMWHGGPDERRTRMQALRAAAEGTAPLASVLGAGAWEKPMDFVAALSRNKPAAFHALNTINRGQISNLPRNVFVETAAEVDAAGVRPQQVTLPATVLPYCSSAAAVTDAIVRAALARSRKLVHEAVELDPTIVDKAAGLAAIDAVLEAHADMLPGYR